MKTQSIKVIGRPAGKFISTAAYAVMFATACLAQTADHDNPLHTVRVITYNVQFLPGLAAAANERSNAPYRANQLGGLLTKFDIVGLNEVFDDAHRDSIVGSLRSAWGDSFAVVEGPEPEKPGRFNGGLALATRLPVLETNSTIYQNFSKPEDFGLRADGFAAKGVLHARIKRANDASDFDFVDVFVTHLEARDGSLRPLQYAELARFVRSHADADHPTVIMGDFNTRGAKEQRDDSSSQYSQLARVLTDVLPGKDLIDLWPHHHGDALGGTSDQASSDVGKRIDYILLAVPEHDRDRVLSADARVNPYLDSKVVALSDHSAVEADLLWKPFVETTKDRSTHSVSRTVSFVPAFERFARHGEIDEKAAGELLATELSCLACHASANGSLVAKRGPQLNGVGNRIKHDWMARFIADPQAVKPGTTMPQLLSDQSDTARREIIRKITAFLATLEVPYPEIRGTGAVPVPHEFWNQGVEDQGRVLFHRVGCVACHQPDETYETVRTKPTPLDKMLDQLDDDELAEYGLEASARRVDSVPLGNLADKYTAQSLTFFLMAPHKVRPAGRMPDFQLAVVDAADIASWLMRDQLPSDRTAADRSPQQSDVEEGRQLFLSVGCVECHDVESLKSKSSATAWEKLNLDAPHSCVNQPTAGQPRFTIDVQQLAALRATVSVAGEIVAPRLQQTMLQLNCYACHERDRQGGIGRYRKACFETFGHVDIGDEGRLPPPLTAVGQKLRTKWMGSVLAGKSSVRPHMRIRMPVFPSDQVKEMPQLFAAADQSRPVRSEADVFGDQTGLADAGRQLLNTGCVQCHALRGESLPGVVGVDLAPVSARVHPQWFYDFLLDPGKLKPGTRMPTFFPNGRSQNPNVLDGDADRQIAAIWAYLKTADKHPLPDKLEQARSASYELIPTDRPVLLRTFMKDAGTHALAVGLPEKLSFAFDTEQSRLALAWKGRFLDAQGTWFVRFAPNAEPLGTNRLRFADGPLLAVLGNGESAWPENAGSNGVPMNTFHGYRLDSEGVPAFLYRSAGCGIEDRIVAGESDSLVRQLTLSPHDPSQSPVWLRPLSGKKLTVTGSECRSDDGLVVTVKGASDGKGIIHESEKTQEWRIPVTIDQPTTIRVEYKW